MLGDPTEEEVGAMFRFEKILVPLDGSDFAELALEPALAIARGMDAEVVLFRVAQPIPRTQALAQMPDVFDDIVAATEREAEEYLARVRAGIPDQRVSTEVRPGEAGVARQIVDYADTSGVDLIVMSSHGLTGVKRWAYGSVAEKVTHSGPCAVLVVRCQSGRGDVVGPAAIPGEA
jgi:nucleotide-binding universal stress UspA family protein